VADPQELLIYKNIETELERINPVNTDINGNPFRTEVKEVLREIPSYSEVQQFPSLGFMPEITTIAPQPFNCHRMVMPLLVSGYFQRKGSLEAAQDAGTKIRDDMFAAIMQDPTRGGNATGTFPVSLTGDDGIRQQEGMVLLRFNIVYFRTSGIT